MTSCFLCTHKYGLPPLSLSLDTLSVCTCCLRCWYSILVRNGSFSRNMYFNPDDPAGHNGYFPTGLNFSAWQATGHDQSSINANPVFQDPSRLDTVFRTTHPPSPLVFKLSRMRVSLDPWATFLTAHFLTVRIGAEGR